MYVREEVLLFLVKPHVLKLFPRTQKLKCNINRYYVVIIRCLPPPPNRLKFIDRFDVLHTDRKAILFNIRQDVRFSTTRTQIIAINQKVSV